MRQLWLGFLVTGLFALVAAPSSGAPRYDAQSNIDWRPADGYASNGSEAAPPNGLLGLLFRQGRPRYSEATTASLPPRRVQSRRGSANSTHRAAIYNGPGASQVGGNSYSESSAPASVDPRFRRQRTPFSGSQAPGTIVIDSASKYLYLVQGGGQAMRYGIGVGRPGFAWSGFKTITRKAEWPAWTPPAEMLMRRPDLPTHMEGGPANPLGARAMYLGSSLYRIHGTNEPETIGTNVSSGCIRMMNQDVIDLYDRVHVGTKVVVL